MRGRVTCAVATCKSPQEATYYCFPKGGELRARWAALCKRDANVVSQKSPRICSLHFEADAYERDLQGELLGLDRRKRLRKAAVPSLRLPGGAGPGQPSAFLLVQATESPRPKVEDAADRKRSQREERAEVKARKALVEKILADSAQREEAEKVKVKKRDTLRNKWMEAKALGGQFMVDAKAEPFMKDAYCQNDLGNLKKALMQVQALEAKVNRLRSDKKALAAEVRTLRSKKHVNVEVARVLRRRGFSEAQAKIVLMKPGFICNWHLKDVVEANHLWSLSRKAYEYIRFQGRLPLPSHTTLLKRLAAARKVPRKARELEELTEDLHRAVVPAEEEEEDDSDGGGQANFKDDEEMWDEADGSDDSDEVVDDMEHDLSTAEALESINHDHPFL